MKDFPQALFHYTKFESTIKILESEKLKFGNLSSSNDISENGYNGLYKYQCFTYGSNSDEVATKPRMWDQYGNKNTGCCIEIDFKKYVEINNIPMKNCFKIEYKNRHYFLENRFNEDDERLLKYKLDDWREEQEFRIISKTDAEYSIQSCINCIYIGYKATEHFSCDIFKKYKFRKMFKVGAVIADWGILNEILAEQYNNGGVLPSYKQDDNTNYQI